LIVLIVVLIVVLGFVQFRIIAFSHIYTVGSLLRIELIRWLNLNWIAYYIKGLNWLFHLHEIVICISISEIHLLRSSRIATQASTVAKRCVIQCRSLNTYINLNRFELIHKFKWNWNNGEFQKVNIISMTSIERTKCVSFKFVTKGGSTRSTRSTESSLFASIRNKTYLV